MNREIIFRGKRVDNDEWIEGYLFKIWDRTFILWGMTGDVPNMVEVKPETVGQYTGLEDCYGKKIFEGDIVGLDYNDKMLSNGDVQFDYGVFGVEWTGFKKNNGMVGGFGQLHNLRRLDDGLADRIKVIGNIFDNKEKQNDKL